MKYYYTSQQIKKKFNWSRQMLSTVAIREGWHGDFRKRPRWYDAIQVRQYEVSRLHTDQAIQDGSWRNGQRIIRHNTKLQSTICPVCAKEITMFVYFCPECKTRYYVLPSDRYGQECKCLNCGKVFHLHFVDCVEEFEEDKYPEGWQKL